MVRSSEAGFSPADEVISHLLGHPARLGGTRLLCIDGAAGSGKTTLTESVAAALDLRGVAATTVHLDHLYRGWDDLAATPGRVRRELLEPLAAGAAGRYRRWDWHASELAEEHLVPPAPCLIIEGVGSGSRSLGEFATTVVWVELEPEVRRQRALARDGAVFAPHWERWAAQEDVLFAHERVAERADVVIRPP